MQCSIVHVCMVTICLIVLQCSSDNYYGNTVKHFDIYFIFMYLLNYSVTFSHLYILFTHYLYFNEIILACLSLRIANVIFDQRNITSSFMFFTTLVFQKSPILFIVYVALFCYCILKIMYPFLSAIVKCKSSDNSNINSKCKFMAVFLRLALIRYNIPLLCTTC